MKGIEFPSSRTPKTMSGLGDWFWYRLMVEDNAIPHGHHIIFCQVDFKFLVKNAVQLVKFHNRIKGTVQQDGSG